LITDYLSFILSIFRNDSTNQTIVHVFLTFYSCLRRDKSNSCAGRSTKNTDS